MSTPWMPATLPERRDVDAAYSMAMSDFMDAKRAKAEYGPGSDVFKAAWAAYEASWKHFEDTKRWFAYRLDKEA